MRLVLIKDAPTADFERLVDFTKALVNQHPGLSLAGLKKLLNRYCKIMQLHKDEYVLRLEGERLSINFRWNPLQIPYHYVSIFKEAA